MFVIYFYVTENICCSQRTGRHSNIDLERMQNQGFGQNIQAFELYMFVALDEYQRRGKPENSE